ncbi:MAG: type II secretion system protein [Candidatus Omnitrophica bacterium]|nr:type II secretion system protein [Candidatus Omnitrophota bacterium]
MSRNSSGFTLAELVIALVVFSIIVTAALPIMAGFAQSGAQAEIARTAAMLAEYQYERVSGMRFSQLRSEGPRVFKGDLYTYYTYQVVVEPSPPELGLDPEMNRRKSVKIIIRHTSGERVEVQTYVTNKH